MKLRFLTILALTTSLFSKNISEDINAFGFALSKPLSGNSANAVYSPFSLFTCLSLAASGAEGSTKLAMETGLGWSQDRQGVAKSLHALSGKLFAPNTEKNCDLQVNCANALFAEQDTPLLPGFRTLAVDDYRGDVQTVDFSKSAEALQIINAWVGNETRQKIPDLLEPGDVDPSTRLVLVNALYFKGAWQKPFDKKQTRKKPFNIDDTTSLAVPMMRQVDHFRYFDDADVQAAILPLCITGNARISFMVVLPKTPGDLSSISEKMSWQILQKYLKSSASCRLDLQLPSFCLRKRYDLQSALSALGMGVAFTDEADFSGIDGMHDLFLSRALHEGYFDLNENGIEAAAATAAGIGTTSVGPAKQQPISFIANHPFLFFLLDETSGAVLFAGKFSDPNLTQCM